MGQSDMSAARQADSWNPETYLSYAALRERPAQELLARVHLDRVHLDRVHLDRAANVIDLGCGPGNSTSYLAARFPSASLTGLDSSGPMLAKARDSGLRASWIESDIADWAPEVGYDLIYSNAALHWLEDHDSLLPRLFGHVRPGGALAVQMPRNFEAPSHTTLHAVAENGPWAEALDGVLKTAPVMPAAEYQRLLSPLARAVDAWETTYIQRLTGEDPVLNWVRGTALTPVQAALDEEAYAAFEDAYGGLLRQAYPRDPDGSTLFPFTRVFFVAYR
ncbi:MAG: methyltransferase domain-containing protein [Alphaproteobacteria bacterium]|nr:methyltransferase domain-containing protein [Alphaproteobacteria bacterium]